MIRSALGSLSNPGVVRGFGQNAALGLVKTHGFPYGK